ncbi:MAG TPA: FG-GAP-like repeat-containing protein, partial [Pyrinomonadaceae bacterium]|nr:FG-GAP-like repeat-containing protein [Pyrinomonadaceae bacterium]
KIASRFSNNFDARSVVARDFNSDGKIDLAVANRIGNSVSVYLGDGLGAFAAARVFDVGPRPTFFTTNGPFSLAAADFNGDNKLDLVTANFEGSSVSILSGDGAGNFAAQKFVVDGLGYPQYVITGDFNLDAKVDVAITRNGHSTIVTILFGNGNGGFSAQTDFPAGTGVPEALTAGDLNADSKPDLVVGSNSGGSFSVLLNDGAGGFNPPTSYNVNINAGQGSVATIGDFNGDGKVDLVVANYLRDKLALFPGDGAGVFANPTFIDVGEWPTSLVAGDFNGDGFLDVATAYVDSGAISVLLNSGTGGFVAPKNYLAGTPHAFLAGADFNGDGLLDLATEAINVFLNSCSRSVAPSLPTLAISNVSVGESSINAVFEVSLSSPSSQTVSVRYHTTGGSAVSGADYQVSSGTLIFAPGEIVKTVAVLLVDDIMNEFTETFSLSLHHPVNAAIKKGRGTGSIVDSDPPPTVTLNNVWVVEGNSGTTQANFGPVLSSPSGKLIRLTYSTSDMSATAGSDYQAANVSLKIAAGSPSPSISILVNGDTAIEFDETFSVSISNVLNATLTGASATVTIFNDDGSDPLRLLSEESGPNVNQAAALEALLFVRDPFRVLSRAEFWDFGPDRNTRVIVFVANLTLNSGETAAAVTVALTDSNGQTHDIAAEDVRAVPNSNPTQVTFRLPDSLPAGNCQIRIRAHGQTSNAGTIRIVS